MWALRFDGDVRLGEIETPTPGPGEALLAVRRAGICSTDLEIVKGYMGFRGTLGHEMVGEVLTHPDPEWVGQRVAAEINLACGRCEACAHGMRRHCPTRSVLGILNKDGCFAERVTVPVENLHRIPDAIDDDLAVLVEPLAAAYEILEQVHVGPDQAVAVLGDGKLGTLAALVLQTTGAKVHLIGRHARRLDTLRERGLRTHTADASIGTRFDIVVEATGNPTGLARARAMVRPRGTLVLKSTFFGSTEVDLAPFVIDEIALIGSRCGPYPPAIRGLAERRIDPRLLIEETFALRDGVQALEKAAERGVAKVLLTM